MRIVKMPEDVQFINKLFKKYLKDRLGNIIDVGACQGAVVDCMLEYINDSEKIFAFEPNPNVFEYLNNKYKNNKNIVLYNLACSNTNEIKDFYLIEDHLGSCTLDQRWTKIRREKVSSIVQVEVVSLDTILGVNEKIKFIKTDAESYDFLVLQGAENIIKTHRPVIFFESSGLTSANLHHYRLIDWYTFFKNNNYILNSPYEQFGNEKFVLKNLFNYHSALKDIVAIPAEHQTTVETLL